MPDVRELIAGLHVYSHLAVGLVSVLTTGERLLRLAANAAEWSQQTFGPDNVRGPLGPLKHLEKEAREAQKEPTDLTEYADCLLLILDASRRAGFSVDQVIDAAFVKLEVNKARTWPKPVDDMPVEHVRDGQ
jgi:hypothetical protein